MFPLCLLIAGFLLEEISRIRMPKLLQTIWPGLFMLAPALQSVHYSLMFTNPDPRYVSGRWLNRNLPAESDIVLPDDNISMPVFHRLAYHLRIADPAAQLRTGDYWIQADGGYRAPLSMHLLAEFRRRTPLTRFFNGATPQWLRCRIGIYRAD
jgi:hypothetical protein